jgi:PAS domain S-box-containing protein
MKSIYKQPEPDTLLQHRLIRFSAYCAVFVLIIGLLVLIGWIGNIALLKRPVPHLAAMNPLTATNFILAALSFLLLFPAGPIRLPITLPERSKILTGNILAGFVLVIGVLKIAGAVQLVPFQIDQVLFAKRLISDAAAGNLLSQMTLNTAFSFILAGTSLLLLDTETKTGRRPAYYTAVAIGMLGLFSLIGYLYHVQAFYGAFRYIPMAIPSAGCFLLISFSLLFATPGRGIMSEFTSTDTGGVTARRLLPLGIFLPILFGYLRLWGHWLGLFSIEFGVTVLVLSIVLIFVLLIGYNTRLLNKRDALKKVSEISLLVSEERYRVMVNSVKDYAIFMLDPEGYVMSWNGGAERIKGYKAEEIVGRHMSVFYTNEEINQNEPAQNLARARAEGRLEKEGWRVRKDGTPFWANIVFTPLYDPNGELMGFAKVSKDMTEKKKAEDQIAYMARLLEDTNDAIFSTDPDFMIRTWNKAAELLFGYSLAEVKGRTAGSVLRTQTTEPVRHAIRMEMIQTGYWKGEVHYLNREDTVLTILLSASEIKNAAGEQDGFVMVCRDFTERKKLEQQLQQFNKDLEEQVRIKTAELTGIFERITDAFIAMDKNFCYTYLNKKAGELIHHDPASLIGKYVWDVFPDAIGSATYLAFNKAMAEQKNNTNTDYYAPLDLWQENHLYPSPEGLSVFIRDITEQKRREKEITDYKYALDQSSIVAITDQRGIILHVNENFCKISKYSPDELIGQDHRIINSGYHPAEFIRDIWVTIARGNVWKGEICNRAKDNSIYWVDTTIVPFLNGKGKPYAYLAIRSDITERKRSEDELQHSYQDIRQLASHLQDVREEERAGIAREIHDELGQQLTGLKMDLSWIAKRLPLQEGDEVRKKVTGTLDLLDITIKTVRRIATALHPSILDDLGLIAALEWQSLEFQKRSGILTEFNCNLEEFNGPPAMAIGLFRICQESLTNVARYAEAQAVSVSLHEKDNKFILLEIKDNGKGFQPDKIGNEKTLGLLGMKERTLMMGGEFQISSTLGKGTLLSVTVPLTINLS